jgi:hypothetical protein
MMQDDVASLFAINRWANSNLLDASRNLNDRTVRRRARTWPGVCSFDAR